jgi:glycosyltransferase involved in cell wall biosynthesis
MYCDSTSADDIAAKISLMMTDDVLRQRYRAMGLARAREFRWDVTAQTVLEILKGQAGVRLTGVPARASAG